MPPKWIERAKRKISTWKSFVKQRKIVKADRNASEKPLTDFQKRRIVERRALESVGLPLEGVESTLVGTILRARDDSRAVENGLFHLNGEVKYNRGRKWQLTPSQVKKLEEDENESKLLEKDRKELYEKRMNAMMMLRKRIGWEKFEKIYRILNGID